MIITAKDKALMRHLTQLEATPGASTPKTHERPVLEKSADQTPSDQEIATATKRVAPRRKKRCW